MRAETLTEKLTKTAEGMRLYQQERAILEVTEHICELMEESNVSRSELAKRLGRSKGYITQLLDGRANMTIRTISDVYTALNRVLHFQDGDIEATVSAKPLMTLREKAAWPMQKAWPVNMQITSDPTTRHRGIAV